MTDEQKAALDLAVLNLKTHGDDQLLTAIKPLLDFYESRRAAGASEGQPDMRDAYVGAREDLAIWEKRALEAEAKLRSGASEGKADRLHRAVWEVERPEHDGFYWLWRISYKGERMAAEIVQRHQGDFLFPGDSKAFKANSTVFVGAYWLPAYIAPQAATSAEIAALRERIAGMEKDSERYRYLRGRFDECSAELDFGRDDLPIGECWVQVHQNLNQGKALDDAIDAAIAKEKQR